MKRDILDDYRDFLMAVRDRMKFELRPRRACLDKDGEVAQELVIKCHMPGGRIAYGVAVVWIPQQLFPHGNYIEPCDTEITFYEPCDEGDIDLGEWEPPVPNPEDELYEDEAEEDPFEDQEFVDFLNDLLSKGS